MHEGPPLGDDMGAGAASRGDPAGWAAGEYGPAAWPEPLRHYLAVNYGPPTCLLALRSGQSGARVYRVCWPDHTAILKVSRQRREGVFYATLAAALRAAGVAVPALQWIGLEAGATWLLLEDIPQALPRDRWLADPAVLGTLHRLHALTLPLLAVAQGFFRPAWTVELNRQALDCLPVASREQTAGILQARLLEHQGLFAPRCPISGDPNPTNWGLRAGGVPVLYDWERFGYGTPALDLAITIPGLGDDAAYTRVAAVYLQAWPADPAAPLVSPAQLAAEIAAARVWSVVEYLAELAARPAPLPPGLDRLRADVPAWLLSLTEPDL